MTKVAVLGAGMVAKPAVDYLIDRCGYEVIVTSLNISEAQRLVRDRPSGTAMEWSIDQRLRLEEIVRSVDLVLSLIPPNLHLPVAKSCLKHQTTMVTTSYISPEIAALDNACRQHDTLILNEVGEDPGLDNMVTKKMIDRIHAEGGKVTAVNSYGAGLPPMEFNTNPMGYKFSWSPKGMLLAAQTPAVILDKGEVVKIPATELFDAPRHIELKGLGTFEAYPNRDCRDYLTDFGLSDDVSLFRGILRYPSWSETMRGLAALGMLDTSNANEYSGKSFAEFTASSIGARSTENIRGKTARFLEVDNHSELIAKLNWLGFFSHRGIELRSGTKADLLVEMMVRKMSYTPFEADMVVIHSEVTGQFSEHTEKRVSTLVKTGEPGRDTAMSQAVAFPAAIASKLILEGRIQLTGVARPTHKSIYSPVLDEMSELGYHFSARTIDA
jgi:saccharopine dehydrogenase-like NADP-dependent oxidoreductase